MTAAAPAYSVNRGPASSHAPYSPVSDTASIDRLADSLANIEVSTKEKLDLLLRVRLAAASFSCL